MAYTNMMQFVSQAEKEGVTLAEVLSRMLSVKDLDEVQASLAEELSSNYRTIEDFMSDVSVPSIDEILALDHEDQSGLQSVAGGVLSDGTPLECR
jgi:hypothetical protein